MKKLLLLLPAILAYMYTHAQLADAFLLSSGLVVHYTDKGKTDDKILHYFTGYFGEKAIAYYTNKTDWIKPVKKIVPSLIIFSVATLKEAFDKKFDSKDIGATMAGSSIAVVSYSITLNPEKQKQKKLLAQSQPESH